MHFFVQQNLSVRVKKNPHGFRLAVAEPIATNVARSAMQWWAQKEEYFCFGVLKVYFHHGLVITLLSLITIYIHITVTYWWWYSDTQFCFNQSIGVKIKWWIFFPWFSQQNFVPHPQTLHSDFLVLFFFISELGQQWMRTEHFWGSHALC